MSIGTPVIAAVALCAPAFAGPTPGFVVERIASGLDHPVAVVAAPGDDQSLYILERQSGTGVTPDAFARISRLDTATGTVTPWLTLEASPFREAGAHDLAFHPNFATNGRFFVALMADAPSGPLINRVVEGLVGPDGVPSLTRTVIEVPQNSGGSIHAIGTIAFDPVAPPEQRGWLTVLMGDGGPQAQVPSYINFAQNLSSLSGKVLRIDIDLDDFPADPDRNYAIPSANPFANDADPGTRGEILHSGLRSPWRGAYDSHTGDLIVGDVGYRDKEELNFARAGLVGFDFGWPRREGTIETPVPGVGGPQANSVNPPYQWDHDSGMLSITAGTVYRGPIAQWQGRVFFADFVSGRIWSGVLDRDTDPAVFDGSNLTELTEHTEAFAAAIPPDQSLGLVAAFGTDQDQNLYIVRYASLGDHFNPEFDDGAVYRVTPAPCIADRNNDGTLDFFDVQDFLTDFAAANQSADLNADGSFDFFDIQIYLNLFSEGCP